MKVILKRRIFVFLLVLTVCWGSAATVFYAQEPGEELLAEAVDTEEYADKIENSEEPDDDEIENTEDPTCSSEHEEPVTAKSEAEPEIIEEERPEETADENIVYTEEELSDWCLEHRSSGGQVTLGSNIIITDSISIPNAHIVIDTGQYGLVYDGGCLYSSDNMEIIGEGVDVPVLDIQTVIRYGYYWESGWNDVAQELNITATGRDKTGGIALRVRQDDGYSPRYIDYQTEGLIRSYGAGAIGLYLDEPNNIYCLQVEVEGDDSTAVYAPQGANLYYCKLTAEGAGTAVVSGSDETVVDTCATNHRPQDVQVINYRIAGVSGSRLYSPVRQYGRIDFLDYCPTFLLDAGDEHPIVAQVFRINWLLGSIDTDVLGQITIKGRFNPPFQELGLEDDFPLEMTVDVRDPEIPCIAGIWFNEKPDLGRYISFTFWEAYECEDENVILWRSDDGGETWYDFTASPDLEWDGDRMFYYYDEISDIIMLQLEVLDKGTSNIVSLYSVDGKSYGGIGGDRDGGDRNIIYDRTNEKSDDAENSAKIRGDSGDNDSGDNDSENDNSTIDDGETANKNNSISISVFPSIIEKSTTAKLETTAAPKEWEDENTIAISGRRLAAMIAANPEAVTFIKNGIRISLFSNDLPMQELDENQLFLVEIKKLSGSSFSVFFRADAIELSALPFIANIGETVFNDVSLASAVCLDKNENILPSEYDPDTGILSVSMTGFGVFTLQAEQFPETANLPIQSSEGIPDQVQDGQSGKSSSALNVGMIAAGICAILLLANGFVRIKRHLTRR